MSGDIGDLHRGVREFINRDSNGFVPLFRQRIDQHRPSLLGDKWFDVLWLADTDQQDPRSCNAIGCEDIKRLPHFSLKPVGTDRARQHSAGFFIDVLADFAQRAAFGHQNGNRAGPRQGDICENDIHHSVKPPRNAAMNCLFTCCRCISYNS
jgi:hypothetical protein